MTSYPNSVWRLPVSGLAVDRQLGDLRDHRPPEPIGDGGPEHGAVAVAGLLPEQHEVGRLALERHGERVARRHEVRPGCGVVGDEDRPVGAHRERLAQRLERLLGPEGEHDDLAALRLLEPERLLDGVHVGGVQRALAASLEPAGRVVEPLHRGCIGNLLHADDDLHEVDSSAARERGGAVPGGARGASSRAGRAAASGKVERDRAPNRSPCSATGRQPGESFSSSLPPPAPRPSSCPRRRRRRRCRRSSSR